RVVVQSERSRFRAPWHIEERFQLTDFRRRRSQWSVGIKWCLKEAFQIDLSTDVTLFLLSRVLQPEDRELVAEGGFALAFGFLSRQYGAMPLTACEELKGGVSLRRAREAIRAVSGLLFSK